MNTIVVEKECGCFKKSIYDNNMSYDVKDDALLQANMMVKHMNDNFCQKHEFILREEGDNFHVAVDMKTAENSSCCGGGHCS